MATLKEVQIKISAVKKTKQITKAMKMVATSKLRGAQQKVEAFRPYALKFADVLGSLAEKAGEEASPLLIPREEVKKIHIVLCSSDKGLCGGFNSHLVSMAEKFTKEKSGQNIEIVVTNFGKKGRDWCRRNDFSILGEHLGIVGFCRSSLLNRLKKKLKMKKRHISQSIYASLQQMNCLQICFQGIFMFNYTAHFWKHPQANMPRA
jgi:ATP synthase F1 gamma subunit